MHVSAVRSVNYTPLTPLSFLRRSGAVFPDRDAIIYGERRWTYAEFLEDAERMARGIRLAISPGDRVAFIAPNVPELLIAHFAVALAGGILVAINSRLSTSELQQILNHSGASLLFVDAEFAPRVGDLAEIPAVQYVVEIADAEFGVAESGAALGQTSFPEFVARADTAEQRATPLAWDIDDELAPYSINYTSGTTGAPKGVMYSHRGAYLNAMGEIFHNGFTGDSVYLWTLPLFHCNGWCTPWAVTGAGATHVGLRAVRGDQVWGAIEAYGVTNLCGSPTVCSVIANAPEARVLSDGLRITTAGAPPSPTIIAQLETLDAAVVSFSSDKWGERPKAYVVVREGVEVSEAELLGHAREHIARFKVPDYIVFRDDLPRTVTGKVTKAVLRALDDVPEGVQS